MENITRQIKPEQIIAIIVKRRWHIIIPFCLSMILGIFLAISLPKIYEASTLILVEGQRVPEDYVQSVVSADIDDRINTISEQILSRTNLEKIIKDLKLFLDPKYEKMFMEDKVYKIRKQISIEVTRAKGRAGSPDSFTVSYRGKNPQKVKEVANTLAAYFIDENLKVREDQAIGTSQFLEGELNSMRQKLEKVEELMKEYRRKYMGELPEQLDSNLRIMDRLQAQLADRQNSLSEAKTRLVLLENQAASGLSSESDGAFGSGVEGTQTNLFRLKEELAAMQTKYTSKHPDIIRLKRRIEKAEADVLTKRKEIAALSESSAPPPLEASLESGLIGQINGAKLEVISLQNEVKEMYNQLRIYNARIENTPKREQELMSLRRDYQNIQESYSSVLSRKLESEIAVNMEQKQKGERFRVVDPAKLPMKPVEPDMLKLFLGIMVAGIGAGAGLIFLLEYFNNSFRGKEEVETYLGIQVLATVPEIRHPEMISREKIQKVMTGFSIAISFMLFAGFAVVVLSGPENTIEIVRNVMNG